MGMSIPCRYHAVTDRLCFSFFHADPVCHPNVQLYLTDLVTNSMLEIFSYDQLSPLLALLTTLRLYY